MKKSLSPTILTVVMAITILGFVPLLFNFREGKFLVAEWALLACIAILFIKNVWLRLFLLWAVARHVIGFFEIGSVSVNAQIAYFKLSYVALNTLFIYMVAYQSIANKLTKIDVSRVFDGICIVVLIQCFVVMLQNWGVWLFINHREGMNVIARYCNDLIVITDPVNLVSHVKNTYTGWMSNTNMSGSLVAIGLPAFFRKKWAYCIPVVFACLLVIRCLGAIIPAALAIGIYIVYVSSREPKTYTVRSIGSFTKREMLKLLAFAVFGAVCLFMIRNENLKGLLSFSGRTDVWASIITDQISKRFIEGWGLGQFKLANPAITHYVYDKRLFFMQAHNEYIQLVYELGIIGFTLMMAYFAGIFAKLLKSKRKESLIITLGLFIGMLNAGVNFLFHTTVACLFVIYCVLAETITKQEATDGTF